MTRTMIFVAVIALSGPALATECPALWQQISGQMNGGHAALSDGDKAKLSALRQQGGEFHHAGNHPKAIEALKQALALLG